MIFSRVALLAGFIVSAAAATVSPDGSCGGTKGYTCQGSNFGNSCSKNNQCGRDASYYKLSQGCQPAYGYCAPKGSVSPDGSCGGSDMFVCIGSNYGDSCGQYNLCGRDAGYSGNGCQPAYGYCQVCTTTVQPSTSVSTIRSTTTLPVTISGSTTVTVTSGIASATTSTTTTVFSTSTSTTVFTTTTTPSTVVTFTTLQSTSTVLSGTTTTTSTSSPPLLQRRQATFGYALPALPTVRAAATAASNATYARFVRRANTFLSCGTVVSTGSTTTTTFTTTTSTSYSTTTTISTSFTTTPSTTSTSTFTSTSVSSVTVTTTQTSIIIANTPSSTSVVPSITTTTAPAATSTVVVPDGVYSKAVENTSSNSCFYSGAYVQQVGVSDDSTNNYIAAREQCAEACTNYGAGCKGFYFSHSTDPSGNPGAYCLLKQNPYASSDISCNYATTTTYYVIYNKVS